MEIQVRIVSQFGNERVFPACFKAEEFCKIAGTATLTPQAIKSIKALGYVVNVAQDVKSL